MLPFSSHGKSGTLAGAAFSDRIGLGDDAIASQEPKVTSVPDQLAGFLWRRVPCSHPVFRAALSFPAIALADFIPSSKYWKFLGLLICCPVPGSVVS